MSTETKSVEDIPPVLLLELLECDPLKGKLFWLERTPTLVNESKNRSAEHICAQWNSVRVGKEAFINKSSHGYLRGSLYNKRYYAHRVIWAMVNLEWPRNLIDHVNGNKMDNRIDNLREATTAQNSWNQGISKSNTSGYKGVCWCNTTKKWLSYINIDSKLKMLGSFDSPAVAHEMYKKVAIETRGSFANTGENP